MKRLCPACLARRARVVSGSCLVCRGQGTLELGSIALSIHEPDVVSRAVAIVLEAAARDAEDRHADRARRVEAVRAAMGLLRASGLVAGTEGRRGPAKPSTSPAALAAEVSPVPIIPTDWILPEAGSYQYARSDRPGRRGAPVLSDDGHPSHLARVLDPANPEVDTRGAVEARTASNRQAAVLAAAAADSIALRARQESEQ